jgi:hypothetical protein
MFIILHLIKIIVIILSLFNTAINIYICHNLLSRFYVEKVSPPITRKTVLSSYESLSTPWTSICPIISQPGQLNCVYWLDGSKTTYLPVTECFNLTSSPNLIGYLFPLFTHFIYQFIAASPRSSGIPWTIGISSVVIPKLVSSTRR